MSTDQLLQIKQHISVSLEREVGSLMEKIEGGIDDEALEEIVTLLLARVRATAEITRQILDAESGSNDRLEALVRSLAEIKEEFDGG